MGYQNLSIDDLSSRAGRVFGILSKNESCKKDPEIKNQKTSRNSIKISSFTENVLFAMKNICAFNN